MQIGTWVFAVAMVSNIAYFSWVIGSRQVNSEIFWERIFERAHPAGDDCYMAATRSPSKDAKTLIASAGEWKKVKQPYGDQPLEAFKRGDTVLTKCALDLASYKDAPYLMFRPGKSFSKSAFYLNNESIAQLDKTGFVSFPISRKDRLDKTEILVVSETTEAIRYPGLSSFGRVVLVDDPNVFAEIENLRFFDQIEAPLTRAAYLLAILLFLSASWVAGNRYLDTKLLIILNVLGVWSELVVYAPTAASGNGTYDLRALTVAFISIFSFMFSVAFTRERSLFRRCVPFALMISNTSDAEGT